jgi:hypothetical protein
MRRMFYQGVSNRLTQRRYGLSEQRWDFNVNLAKLADLDVESLEGESLRAVIRLYYQLGYASGSSMG